MPSETELLSTFVDTRAEAAFRAIVELHGGMVLATAFRQVGNRALAEEVAQDVFILLTKKASALRHSATIAGWLYKTTLNQSRDRLRSELRRRRRETLFAELSDLGRQGESIWNSLSPLLDEALAALPEHDQAAVALRFMEDRRFSEIGRVLGVGEDAARKRIDKIVHHLSDWFRRRQMVVAPSALAGLLAINVKAAPIAPALAANVAQGALATVASGSALLFSTIIMTSSKLKGAAVVLILLALLVTAPVVLKHGTPARVNSSAPIQAAVESNATRQVASVKPSNNAAPPTAAKPTLNNFFARLQEGDESLTMLSPDQAEAFIRANHTNAESLLAAYQVTRDKEYLRRAAEAFPNDPSVLIRAVAFDVAPEKKREMLEQLKKSDPQNAIASYLSANDHLKNNEIDAALKDFGAAATQKDFHDYTVEQSQTMEEIYLAAGHSPAEAKALGISSLELPHLRQIVDVSRGLQTLMDQYTQSGDAKSASAVAQIGLSLASRLSATDQGGGMRIDEFLGWKMRQGFLNKLDPSQNYPFLDGDLASNLNSANEREKAMQADNGIVSAWIAQASDQEIIAYYDRIKVYGESAALQWLRQRFPSN